MNTFGLNGQYVLTGLFRNDRDLYQAQEVLTDFGYPKESTSIVRLKDRSKKIKTYGKQVMAQVKDKAILGISVAGVLILGALLAGVPFYSTLNISEIALFITVWMALLAISSPACGVTGALIAALVCSVMAEESVNYQEDMAGKQNVLISVAVRTPNDATDIAREWKEIGGEVVQRS